MALRKRGGIWYFRKMINGRLFRESTGFADKKAAERRANEIELDIRAGVHGWKSTIPSFAEWWDVYRKTYTPLKSARNRDAQIVAHFLPHFGARRLDDITKSDIVRYLNLRRTQMTGNPGHKKRRLVSESTVRRERGLLQSIFERAIDEGHDIRNPFRGIKRGKDKPRTRVLTLDEETLLLEASRSTVALLKSSRTPQHAPSTRRRPATVESRRHWESAIDGMYTNGDAPLRLAHSTAYPSASCVFANPNVPCHDHDQGRWLAQQLRCGQVHRVKRTNRLDRKRSAHASEDRVCHTYQEAAPLEPTQRAHCRPFLVGRQPPSRTRANNRPCGFGDRQCGRDLASSSADRFQRV